MFQGFLPKDTAIHHRSVVLDLVREALDEAAIKDPKAEIDAVAFTKVLKFRFHRLSQCD